MQHAPTVHSLSVRHVLPLLAGPCVLLRPVSYRASLPGDKHGRCRAGRSAAQLERLQLPAWRPAGLSPSSSPSVSPGVCAEAGAASAPAAALGPHFIADAAAKAAPAVVHLAVVPQTVCARPAGSASVALQVWSCSH